MSSFEIEFSDLSNSKREEILDYVTQELLIKYREEGVVLMSGKWYVEPKTLEEAYCRTYSIDWKMWSDLEETSEEFQEFDWLESLNEYAREEASKLCYAGMHNMEVEI